MFAGLKYPIPMRACVALLFLVCQASRPAPAQSTPVLSTLDARIATIGELGRYVPDKALAQLQAIEAQARAAPQHTRAEFLCQLSLAKQGLGRYAEALVLADELVALGHAEHDDVALAKGLLTQAYVRFVMGELIESHRLGLEAERVATATHDLALRVQAGISSARSYAKEGNYPPALSKLQEMVALARSITDSKIPLASALAALAAQYDAMKEYAKGFEALDEAWALAKDMDSPGRLAALKSMEYGLAIDSNQDQRALKALLLALKLARRGDAKPMIANILANLSDSYLKAQDYPNTIRFANEGIAAALLLNEKRSEATARVNLGQAYIATGRIAEGKRSFEAGMAFFDQAGDKPELQEVLVEYGNTLEQVGDMAGANAAYHRERALSNELFETRRQKAVLELQEKYEAEKKQRQIQLLSHENQIKSVELDNGRLQQRVWWLLALVCALAGVIGAQLYRKVRLANAMLEVKNLELKAQSSLDPLTALYNRRHFQEFMRTHAQVEKRGAGTSGEDMVGALFLLDVDHFKHVNDTYGHAAGDAVLKMIAENLRVILRETDMIVRWGGEEFLAFLPAIPRSGVEEVARRILAGISAHVIDYQGGEISVDVSIGFAPFPLTHGATVLPWERAVNLVDMALYLAKSHGRNRAYGVRGFAHFDRTSMEEIEADLERAWRAGWVDLSLVLGGAPEPTGLAAAADALVPIDAPAAHALDADLAIVRSG